MVKVNFNLDKNITLTKDYSFNLTHRSNKKLTTSLTPAELNSTFQNLKLQDQSPLRIINKNQGIAKLAFNPFKTFRTPNKVVPIDMVMKTESAIGGNDITST